jgi:hypothetical protein
VIEELQRGWVKDPNERGVLPPLRSEFAQNILSGQAVWEEPAQDLFAFLFAQVIPVPVIFGVHIILDHDRSSSALKPEEEEEVRGKLLGSEKKNSGHPSEGPVF